MNRPFINNSNPYSQGFTSMVASQGQGVVTGLMGIQNTLGHSSIIAPSTLRKLLDI